MPLPLGIGQIEDEHQIILAETVPTAHEFAAGRLSYFAANLLGAVLRVLQLGG